MTRHRWGWLPAMCGLLALGCGKSGPDTDPRHDADDDAPFEPWEQTRFTADEGTPMHASFDGNTAHSVVAAWDIESQHDSTSNLLVDVTRFLVPDYADLGRRPGRPFPRRRARISRASRRTT